MENIFGIIKNKEITLYTEGVIDGAHLLKGYDGKCKQMHGHSWLLKIWVRGKREHLDDVGIMFDFANVKQIVDFFDHQLINEVAPFDKMNPTAENLVSFIYGSMKIDYPDLQFKIRIYETAVLKKTYAEMGDF